MTAYIRSKVYEEAKINFNNREFSGLVEELLLDWNWKQKTEDNCCPSRQPERLEV